MDEPLPKLIEDNPRLGAWFDFVRPSGLTLKTGKVEIGQGILTALRQIAAEELDLPLRLVGVVSGDTARSPNEGPTVASLSIMTSGVAVRLAAGELRGRLVQAAARRLQASSSEIAVIEGDFHLRGAATQESYWSVVDDINLDDRISGSFPLKSPDRYKLVGTSPVSSELVKKISGAAFIHDFELPGMVHGRALRQPRWGARLLSLEAERIRAMNGVIAVVHDGSFVGVLAESEHILFRAMDRFALAARWDVSEPEAPAPTPQDYLASGVSEDVVVCDAIRDHDRNWQYQATYTKPLIGHGSIGPSCALAQFDGDRLCIWTHSQNVFELRIQIGRVLSIPIDRIAVRHLPGAGCYGHNGADDVAIDAALLARAVPGRPVRAQWTRRDELCAEPLGSPIKVSVSASLAEGRVAAWRLRTRSGTHVQRPGWDGEVNMLAASALREPWPFHTPTDVPLEEGGGGGAKNSVAGYDFPQQVVYEFVPNLPFRLSSLRSLGAFANVFAIENAMDELAALAERDPVQFRLDHLSNPRSREVIETVAEMSAWGAECDSGQGKGLGFAQFENEASYCAVVAHVSVDEEVRLIAMWAAVDAGLAVNPGGIVAQVEGGMIQAASWTLKEAVPTFGSQIISETWKDYPILRFDEIPDVAVKIVCNPADASTGVGEVAMGPTAAAISNAVARALGVRIRDLPITRDHIISAIMGDG